MPLITCKECGKEMSDSAKICPHCGYDYTAKSREKRRKSNKIAKWLILVFIGFIVYKCITMPDPVVEGKNKFLEMEKEHCEIIWENLDRNQKEKVLTEFIDKSTFAPNSPNDLAVTLLSKSLKYPGSAEDYYPYGTIQNIDNGIIEYSKGFTSENKLSMKVKGYYSLKIKYTAGCKPFEVISFDVE